LFTFETARSETPDNLWEITFRLTNVIPERIIFVSRGITVNFYSVTVRPTSAVPRDYPQQVPPTFITKIGRSGHQTRRGAARLLTAPGRICCR
jgi:hypothetical protein